MNSAGAKPAKNHGKALWSDTRLVQQCLKGNEEAWAALIAKYKNLIYSIPIKLGFSQDDAADVFQAVCAELISQLPQLRKPQALAGWLIKVTAHRSSLLRRQADRFVDPETQAEPAASGETLPDNLLVEVESEQMLRTALRDLPPRCNQLVEMLFFEGAPRPYEEVARELGIATGSVGFIRGRCLEKLRRRLEELGFK
jgi:RNA polymerase sigma factor (sigma-70 family)